MWTVGSLLSVKLVGITGRRQCLRRKSPSRRERCQGGEKRTEGRRGLAGLPPRLTLLEPGDFSSDLARYCPSSGRFPTSRGSSRGCPSLPGPPHAVYMVHGTTRADGRRLRTGSSGRRAQSGFWGLLTRANFRFWSPKIPKNPYKSGFFCVFAFICCLRFLHHY